MIFKFFWNNKLWEVAIPSEIPTEYRWEYVHYFVIHGGNKVSAMIHVMTLRYPGIGYAGTGN